jgi:transposase
MQTRARWRRGLRLDKGQTLQLRNARARARRAGDETYARRLKAILLLGHERLTQKAVASIFDVTENCITRWVMTFVQAGIEGLRPGTRPGATPRLTVDQKQKLARIIEWGPEAYGLDTGVWTGPIVRNLVESKFGVKYSVEQIRSILHELGFSVQYPKQVLSEASLTAQERWLKRKYPEIKKKRNWIAASSSSKTSASSSSRARSTTRGHGAARGRK